MTTGIYSHYKGNEYTVYGKAENISGDTFVLYRQNYGTCDFWVRPEKMFRDRVVVNNKEIPRFKFIKKSSQDDLFKTLISAYKKENIIIKHSETGEIYSLLMIDSNLKKSSFLPIIVHLHHT